MNTTTILGPRVNVMGVSRVLRLNDPRDRDELFGFLTRSLLTEERRITIDRCGQLFAFDAAHSEGDAFLEFAKSCGRGAAWLTPDKLARAILVPSRPIAGDEYDTIERALIDAAARASVQVMPAPARVLLSAFESRERIALNGAPLDVDALLALATARV